MYGNRNSTQIKIKMMNTYVKWQQFLWNVFIKSFRHVLKIFNDKIHEVHFKHLSINRFEDKHWKKTRIYAHVVVLVFFDVWLELEIGQQQAATNCPLSSGFL